MVSFHHWIFILQELKTTTQLTNNSTELGFGVMVTYNHYFIM
jgi:hypothetical protein